MRAAAAILAAGLAMLPLPSFAAAGTPGAAGSKARKTCDSNIVHTGPRGGKFYRTKDCRKVYLKKGTR